MRASPRSSLQRLSEDLLDFLVCPELDAFFDDLAKTYKDAVAAFDAAGCRYLQFDNTVWALCSQKEGELTKQHGDDPTRLPKSTPR